MLKGKSAVITGGVRGIGRAIAEEFCRQGADVLLCYRSNEEAAKRTAEELKQYGTRVELVKGDVSDPAHAEETAKHAKELFGKIDILVNNAGITKDKLLLKMTPSDFDEVVQANLSGSFYFLQAIAPVMIKQRGGRIINISSIVGVKGNAGQVNYSASKAGLIGATKALSLELAKRRITVNCVAPGLIETYLTSDMPAVYTLVRFAASDCTTIAANRRTRTGSLEVSSAAATNGFASPLATAAYPPMKVVAAAESSAEATSQSRMAMAVMGPRPGITPITVPSRAPTKQ